MLTTRLTLKTVTPLFLHGAKNRGPAELRPPSIKGVMRFWLRALAGGVADLEAVRELEARIFGNTTTGQGITVRTEGAIPQADPRPFLLPHKPDYKSGPKDRLRSPSAALKGEEEFDVVLMDRPGRDSRFLEAAAFSLWLAVNLGGFGQRGRRGAGSLVLTKVEPAITGMQVTTDFAGLNALESYLEKGIKAAKASFASVLTGRAVDFSSTFPSFPVLSSSTARIQIIGLTDSEEQEARAAIMERIAPFKNAVWGLPYGSPANGERKVTRRRVKDKFEAARMASPVWFHLLPRHNGGFFLVQTLLKSAFPTGLEREPDWKKIDDYFSGCVAKGAVEVSLP